MAELSYASNGKGNLGVALGAIGTGLGVFGNGLGNLFGGGMGIGNNAGVRWVSQPEFEQGQRIASLESENALLRAEKNTDSKISDLYTVVNTSVRSLEKEFSEFKTAQAVVNAQVAANIAVAQNNIASLQTELGGLTKTVIPINNICPEPMLKFNTWKDPSSTTTTTAQAA